MYSSIKNDQERGRPELSSRGQNGVYNSIPSQDKATGLSGTTVFPEHSPSQSIYFTPLENEVSEHYNNDSLQTPYSQTQLIPSHEEQFYSHYTPHNPYVNNSRSNISPFGMQKQYSYALPAPLNPIVRVNTLFRYQTTKEINLTAQGNFRVSVPVPTYLLSSAPNNDAEFTHLTYTAVVGDPDEFLDRGYSLRQCELKRSTEIFIVVTMYNEDQTLFLKTFQSLKRNIEHLCKKKKSSVWGPDGWKKVVICIVSDGRGKINQKTLAALGLLGIYQDGIIKTSVSNDPVAAHVFEYSCAVNLDSQYQIISKNRIMLGNEAGKNFPLQILFCLKEKNKKKINSHRWFFNAFGRCLAPTVCVLIDVGTKPSDKSIYYLWKEFDQNPYVAGACGEIFVDKGILNSKIFNPLVAAQNFEVFVQYS